MDCLRWPNTFFVPDDLCELLFWDASPELLSVEATYRIAKMLGLSADVVNPRAGITYGDFIDGIVSHLFDSFGEMGSGGAGDAVP